MLLDLDTFTFLIIKIAYAISDKLCFLVAFATEFEDRILHIW